jgi:glycosyltransferase involved in cell wall biosynthesis
MHAAFLAYNKEAAMRISVVIPAYNEEKYLPQTLHSLDALTRKPDEIVVIDGSSTDATARVAAAAGAKVVTVPKTTIGASRQRGLEEAAGDVVVFTDADTIVPDEWLTGIERELGKPGIVAYFGGFRVPDGPAWYKFYINVLQPAGNMLLWWLFHFPMATGQYMAFYKSKAMEAGGFPVEFKLAEDVEMARRMMRVGKIIYRQYTYVTASGRRGYEGFGKLMGRIPRAIFRYLFTGRADTIGFPDIRK